MAVIDWSDMAVADPAIDLAWLLNGLDGSLRQPLIERLDLDAATVRRADDIHQLGPWWEAYYGLVEGRPELIAGGIAGIVDRLGPNVS
ncbi:MAG: hypothetical protein KY460_10440 [Actinobacteria bacterium]|nr:hypothetical protein [Actinomycetota bacterium]